VLDVASSLEYVFELFNYECMFSLPVLLSVYW
jgi:hypothetical protein